MHWAAQLVAAVGGTSIRTRDDDSHRNLGLDADTGVLAGHATDTEPSLRVGVALSAFALLVRGADGAGTEARLSLAGKTLDEAYGWLEGCLAERLGQATPLNRPEYEMPPHPVSSGAAFAAGLDPAQRDAEFREIAAWYGNAHRTLSQVVAENAGASSIRCWPHHFDIATLITVRAGDEASQRTVGVGMSPGDGKFAEPYFYITPWPYPENPKLDPLPGGGEWNTDGWVGAVLRGSALVSTAGREADSQSAAVREFVTEALRQAKGLLP